MPKSLTLEEVKEVLREIQEEDSQRIVNRDKEGDEEDDSECAPLDFDDF